MSERRDRASQQMKKKKMIKFGVILIVSLLFLSICGLLGRHVLVKGSKLQRELIAVHLVEINDSANCRAIVINEAKVVKAIHSGTFENLIKDEDKVRIGACVGVLNNKPIRTRLYAPFSGVFTSYTDGLDEILCSTPFHAIGPESFEYKVRPKDGTQRVEKGDAVFKVVDNLVPSSLLIQIPVSEFLQEPKVLQKYMVSYREEEAKRITLKDMSKENDYYILLFEFENFRKELLNQRFLQVELVLDSHEGCLIPESALGELDEEKGVYCSKGEHLVFKRVEFVKSIDNKVLVKGLEENDMILSNASAEKNL